ncbi:MAG: hypothetical protein AAF548_16695 [Actinomycetota bacterium]
MAPFRILVVCTANICRSVMAEQMLGRESARRGLDVAVSSCGLLFDGEPASDTVIDVLEEFGIDASRHRSRRFDPAMLDDVDLVVTMERMHARELSVTREGSSPRIHTLGAMADWLDANADPARSPAATVAACAAQRSASDLLGAGSDEVEDPHGRSRRLHRKTAERLDGLTAALLDGLFAQAVDRPD